jgi:hypothetical protein
MLAFFVYLLKYLRMISIASVYRTLKSLANEEQKGFITPYSFNDFAQTAQMNVYNEILAKELMSSSVSRSQRDSSFRERSKQQLAFFETDYQDTGSSLGVYDLPSNCNYVNYLSYGTTSSQYYGVPGSGAQEVEIEYDLNRFNRLRRSKISKSSHVVGASSIMLVAYVSGTQVHVANGSPGSVLYVKYTRTPGSVSYTGFETTAQPSLSFISSSDLTASASYEIDDSASLNFDLPPSFHSEVVNEMAKLIGIQLEETGVYSYGVSEETAKEAPKNN